MSALTAEKIVQESMAVPEQPRPPRRPRRTSLFEPELLRPALRQAFVMLRPDIQWANPVLFLGFWFFIQLLNGIAASAAHFGGGVAWWAHVGGFAAGVLMVLSLRQTRGEANESESQRMSV
jgi:membrane associated rhomboid family serine protease